MSWTGGGKVPVRAVNEDNSRVPYVRWYRLDMFMKSWIEWGGARSGIDEGRLKEEETYTSSLV